MSAGVGIGAFMEGLLGGAEMRRKIDAQKTTNLLREREAALSERRLQAAESAASSPMSTPAEAASPSGSTALAGAPAINGGGVGHGALRITYDGALDKSATGRASPKSMFDFLKSAGATDNEAVMLTGAAASESGLNHTAVHDGNTGYGLFGHRLDRLTTMRAFAGTDRPSWQQQAQFALQELRSRPEAKLVAAARTPEELTIAQMHFEQPQGYKRNNPMAGHNFNGRLGTISRFSSFVGSGAQPAPAPAAAPAAPAQPMQADAKPLPYSPIAVERGVSFNQTLPQRGALAITRDAFAKPLSFGVM